MADKPLRTFADMSDLERLSQPFPREWVEQKSMGGGRTGSYINQGIVKQRMLGALQRTYDLKVVEIIRGDHPAVVTGKGTDKERTWPALTNIVVCVLARVTCEVDGRPTSVEEYGTPEAVYQQPHDGERLKRALTDAVKRAAVHLGVGLEFPSKGTHPLPAVLAALAGQVDRADQPEHQADAPDHDAVDPDEVHAELPAEQAAEPGPQRQPSEGPADYLVRWLRTAGPLRVAAAVARGQADADSFREAADVLDAQQPDANPGWRDSLEEHLQAGRQDA